MKVGMLCPGVLPSTHLVCPKPEGQKYAASVKWGVPAVTKDWLLSCARQGVRVAEDQFLVTNPQGIPSYLYYSSFQIFLLYYLDCFKISFCYSIV